MGLNFAGKAFFFIKQIDFPEIRYKNVEYFNLAHAHKPLPFFFPFSRPFYSRYLLRFISFQLGVNYGQSQEMGP